MPRFGRIVVPSLQIRNLPAEAYEALAVRAKAAHRSLAQQALAELETMPELRNRKCRLAV
ncbi:FitA-like ribbon-helix-helix domain-containing protein, partial [Deferrisoma palaeochoriense]